MDTSGYIQLGIIDDSLDFIDYRFIEGTRNFSTIHSQLNDLLEKNQVGIGKIEEVFLLSGPGSYTGMRIGEGIAQIFKWQEKKIYSFYHFEIPSILGIESGTWISQAYKGELFVHTWGQKIHHELLREDKFFIDAGCYCAYGEIGGVKAFSTQALLRKSPQEVFVFVRQRGEHRGPFYYRKSEEEFSI